MDTWRRGFTVNYTPEKEGEKTKRQTKVAPLNNKTKHIIKYAHRSLSPSETRGTVCSFHTGSVSRAEKQPLVMRTRVRVMLVIKKEDARDERLKMTKKYTIQLKEHNDKTAAIIILEVSNDRFMFPET